MMSRGGTFWNIKPLVHIHLGGILPSAADTDETRVAVQSWGRPTWTKRDSAKDIYYNHPNNDIDIALAGHA